MCWSEHCSKNSIFKIRKRTNSCPLESWCLVRWFFCFFMFCGSLTKETAVPCTMFILLPQIWQASLCTPLWRKHRAHMVGWRQLLWKGNEFRSVFPEAVGKAWLQPSGRCWYHLLPWWQWTQSITGWGFATHTFWVSMIQEPMHLYPRVQHVQHFSALGFSKSVFYNALNQPLSLSTKSLLLKSLFFTYKLKFLTKNLCNHMCLKDWIKKL